MSKTPKPEVRNEFIAICHEKGCKFEFRFLDDDTVKLGSKSPGLSLVTDEEGYTWVEGQGERYTAEILEKSQNRYHILINGNSYHFSVETPFSFKRKKFLNKLRKGSKLVRLNSPMPGKIVELMVAEGDKVSAGDEMLILEAMKMQNEIRTEITGIVTKIHVKPGVNVMKDEILLEVSRD